jgi:hypothetical protein
MSPYQATATALTLSLQYCFGGALRVFFKQLSQAAQQQMRGIPLGLMNGERCPPLETAVCPGDWPWGPRSEPGTLRCRPDWHTAVGTDVSVLDGLAGSAMAQVRLSCCSPSTD